MGMGAGRRAAVAGGQGPAVHAGRHVTRFLRMTTTAGLRLLHKVKRRRRRGGWQNAVRPMAITTGGGIPVARFARESMNTGTVTFTLHLMTTCATYRRHRPIVVGMGSR